MSCFKCNGIFSLFTTYKEIDGTFVFILCRKYSEQYVDPETICGKMKYFGKCKAFIKFV